MSAAEDNTWGENVHLLATVDDTDPVMAQWARFRDRFAEAVEGTLYTLQELESDLAAHRSWLFAGRDSAIIGQTNDDVMQLMWAVGDIAELVTLLPGIEAVARMQGAARMMIEGPRGWERVLKGAGYGFYSVTLTKEL